MIDLTGTTAVVTGAGSGIGRATATTLAEAGATVAAADIDLDSARASVDAIAALGGKAGAYFVDVTEPDAVTELRDAVNADLGLVTVLANVAGWDRTQPFIENDRPFWDKVLAINLMGPITVTRTFLDGMMANETGGRVVNVSSDAGRVGSLGETVYSSAKGGVIAFTKALAREMARYRINVNCVCPGPTDTPLLAAQPPKVRDAMVRATPFRRLGQPQDVANAIAFFASDRASFITGQVLSVSGGLTMNG